MTDANDGENENGSGFQFEISLSVLNHLGRNLYRNFITVLGEAISNAWDAEAKNIYITINREDDVFSILDDGNGMTSDEFQNKFLKIGYSKRAEIGLRSKSLDRPFIGAKGIGKLALLSCADEITIASKTSDTDVIGGVINNKDLDNAIKEDMTPEQYPLKTFDENSFSQKFENVESGTFIHFAGTKNKIRNTVDYIRKQVALYFRFSLLDSSFNIYINDKLVTFEDIKELTDSTEFVWLINDLNDPEIAQLTKLKADAQILSSQFSISGFVATVQLPKHLKVLGADEKVSVDLFVNGRLRERDIVKHVPTNRLIESYWYGQIHFDILDGDGVDRFTSSREGVKSEDDLFMALLKELKTNIFNKVLDRWDDLRLARGEDGDDENVERKSKVERRATSLFNLAASDYIGDDKGSLIDKWIKELRPDSEFNVPAYIDCYISENLIRRYIHHNSVPIITGAQNQINDWKRIEQDRLREANISFPIRQENDDLSYLGMDALASIAYESNKQDTNMQGLKRDAVDFRPVRNAVGHTGLVTTDAKERLRLVFQNIRGKLKTLLNE